MNVVSPSPMSISYSTRANKYSATERHAIINDIIITLLLVCFSYRSHDIKPGGPPVQSLHEHTKSPIGQQPLFGSGGVSTSPERRQVNKSLFNPLF